MQCLQCEGKTKVVNTRIGKSGITIRQRNCKVCGAKMYSVEEYVDYEDIKDEYLEAVYSAINISKKKGIKND